MHSRELHPLVSIVVPVYNTKEFLPGCLKSIAEQSYKNIEIILVNDGSTDGSLKVCEDFLAIEKRARLFSQSNSGVASARNLGVSQARGDFIIHADSDDLVPVNSLSVLVELAVSSQCDVAIGSYVIRRPSGDKFVSVGNREESSESFLAGLIEGRYHGGLWDKLIKRELYNGLSFQPGIDCMEDVLMLVKILSRVKHKICFTDESVYIYVQRGGSCTKYMSEHSISSSESATDTICGILADLFPKQTLQGFRNTNRLIVLQYSVNPLSVFDLSRDIHILSDKNIPLFKKIPIWALSKNFELPMRIYKIVRRIFRPVY